MTPLPELGKAIKLFCFYLSSFFDYVHSRYGVSEIILNANKMESTTTLHKSQGNAKEKNTFRN